MSEMIERVARALAARSWGVNGNDKDGVQAHVIERRWPSYADDARAAIEAMREPTEAMKAAAAALVDYDRDEYAINPAPSEAYTAMIDAALK